MLAILVAYFYKVTTHLRVRIALVESYIALLATPGLTWTEPHYTTTAARLLSLVGHFRPKAASATMPAHPVRYERLLVRQIFNALHQRALSERALQIPNLHAGHSHSRSANPHGLLDRSSSHARPTRKLTTLVQDALAESLGGSQLAQSNRHNCTRPILKDDFGLGTTSTPADPGRRASSRTKARISPVPVECVALSVFKIPTTPLVEQPIHRIL
ncbi:hypothetical protein BDV93DRAFT_612173 [Ceratobasidium sp. AG-I]|nr:hypothetical protein BDV93DRAFT_612173 [Ceratobasidium sp. AG-I]